MRPIATNGVEWSVGLSVTVVSPAKTAEPIDMPSGGVEFGGLKEPGYYMGPRSPCQRAMLRGKGAVH